MRKQIAGALVASLLIGSVPAWAEGEKATAAVKSTLEEQAQRQQFRDSIDRAMEGAPAAGTTGVVLAEPGASGPELTSQERRDLDGRRAALRTDPVARGAGSMVMMLVGAAVSIGGSIYLYNRLKKDYPTPQDLGRP